jgi:TatD DNase family protein
VIQRAVAAGVDQIVVTGTTVEGSQQALQLARKHPDRLRATAGIHPHHAASYGPANEALLRELLAHPAVVAVGEAGLDYVRDRSSRADQQRAFEAQLALAVELGMPLFAHQRGAHDDFLAMMKNVRASLPAAVVHCFTDDARALNDYLELDLHIGLTGWICDERRGTHLKELAPGIPAGRLMVETDAPYLLPRDIKPKPPGRRNEPALLPHVVAAVARCRGESVDETAAHTTATARAFFGL